MFCRSALLSLVSQPKVECCLCNCCRWTSQYCEKASLLIKLDDDVLISYKRIHKLKSFIDKLIDTKAPVYAGELDQLSTIPPPL